MRVAVVDLDQAEAKLARAGTRDRPLGRGRNGLDALLRPFRQAHRDGLRAAVAHVFETGRAARQAFRDLAAQAILRAHWRAVERDEHAVRPQADARRRLAGLAVLHARAVAAREFPR